MHWNGVIQTARISVLSAKKLSLGHFEYVLTLLEKTSNKRTNTKTIFKKCYYNTPYFSGEFLRITQQTNCQNDNKKWEPKIDVTSTCIVSYTWILQTCETNMYLFTHLFLDIWKIQVLLLKGK